MDNKGKPDRNTVIVGYFNTPSTWVGRSFRQKINKEIAALNETLDQMELIDIFKAFHLKEAECAFFSSVHETFSRIDHMLRHKRSLNKSKKIKIISSIYSDHKDIKLEVNHKKKLKTHKEMEDK